MALPKITDTQLNENGVISAPDILTGTTQENKAIFDRLVRSIVAPAYNACVDAVNQINEKEEEWGNKETERQENENARKEQESRRVEAEQGRSTAEEGRVTAETQRASAEQERKSAETTRAENENSRKSAETDRASAETTRTQNEQGRVTAENQRADNEGSRVRNETVRVNQEESRVTAEDQRESDETKRASAENQRADAETARNNAEEQRASAEQERKSAESTRVSNENARQQNETDRRENEQQRKDNEQTRQEAEAARGVFENYDTGKAYVPGNKVAYGGSSYLNQKACNGIAPTDTEYWLLIAKKGADGDGKGDMVKATYDPDGKETDVYRYVGDAVAAHNTSSSSHSDIRSAIDKKQDAISDLAAIRSGAAKGATAVQQSVVGKPSGVASLGTDGKVPSGQLPETKVDAFTKAETLQDATAALYGKTDAVPDDLFQTLSKSALRTVEKVKTKEMFVDWQTVDVPKDIQSISPIRKTGGKIYLSGFTGSEIYLLTFDGTEWKTLAKVTSVNSSAYIQNVVEYDGVAYVISENGYLYKVVDGVSTFLQSFPRSNYRYDGQALIAINGKLLFSCFNSSNRYAEVFLYDIASDTYTTWSTVQNGRQGKGIPAGTDAVYKNGKYYFTLSGWDTYGAGSIVSWSGLTTEIGSFLSLTSQGFPLGLSENGSLHVIDGHCYVGVGDGNGANYFYGFAKLSDDMMTATYLSHDLDSKFYNRAYSLHFENMFFELDDGYYVLLEKGYVVKNSAKDLVSWEKAGEVPLSKETVSDGDIIGNIGNDCFYYALYSMGPVLSRTSDEYTTRTFLTDLFGEHLNIPGEQIVGGVQIATGSYTGTGTYGASNPNTLTFEFEPKYIVIYAIYEADYGSTPIKTELMPEMYGVFNKNSAFSVTYYKGNNANTGVIKEWGTTVSFYGQSTTQPNKSGMLYKYFAIG